MAFRYRLVIIIIFVLIFVISAPAVILYGQGYRYDLAHHRLTKTGNFLINSVPDDALVSINGQTQQPDWYQRLLFYKKFLGLTKIQGTTPTTISNLLPDKYQISIQKNGYQPWQKKLEILPEKTTNVGKVYLFLEDLKPELILNDKVDFAYPLIKDNRIIYSTYQFATKTSDIKLVDYSETRKKPIFITAIDGHVIRVEEFSNFLLIEGDEHQFLIADLSTKLKVTSLNNFFTNPKKVMFHDNLFFVQVGNLIFSWDQNAKIYKLIFDCQNIAGRKDGSALQDWVIQNNYLLILRRVSAGLILEKYKLEFSPDKYKSESAIFSLSLPAYQFKFNPDQLNDNLLIFRTDREVAVIDTAQNINPIIYKNRAKDFLLNVADKSILYYNDFEIMAARAIKNHENLWIIKEGLINRGSQLIDQIMWYLDGSYVMAVSQNNVWAIEVDGRDTRNIYKILEGGEIKKIWFTNNSRYLYLSGKLNKQEGIWRMRVR